MKLFQPKKTYEGYVRLGPWPLRPDLALEVQKRYMDTKAKVAEIRSKKEFILWCIDKATADILN